MGQILVRGEEGHDITQELDPKSGEPVIDKPGNGSFHATDLHQILLDRKIKTLVVRGVTTEVCVHTTVREPNERRATSVSASATAWPPFSLSSSELRLK
jgi:nicotinamidase-related amidase